MLSSFLEQCGLHTKEQEIYTLCCRLWKCTPSLVAQQLGRERTSTYKLMCSMVHKGILIQTTEHHTTYFLPVDIETLKKLFAEKFTQMQQLDADYDLIKHEYEQLISPYKFTTTVKIYEWTLGLQQVYQQILTTIQETGLIHLKCIASKTFESLANTNKEIVQLHHGFVHELRKKDVVVSSVLGEGMSLMEQLVKSRSLDDIVDMPSSNDAVSVRIVGSQVFVMIYKKTPQIIHIGSTELANLLHFVIENLKEW